MSISRALAENPRHAQFWRAQACGKPVIACIPTPKEALCPRTGRLVPMNFHPALLHNIRRSLAFTDPATPRAFVLQNRDLSAVLDRYIDLFRRITAGDERNCRHA